MAFILLVLSLKISCYSFTQMQNAEASISSGQVAHLLWAPGPLQSHVLELETVCGEVWRVHKAFPWGKLRVWVVSFLWGNAGSCTGEAGEDARVMLPPPNHLLELSPHAAMPVAAVTSPVR